MSLVVVVWTEPFAARLPQHRNLLLRHICLLLSFERFPKVAPKRVRCLQIYWKSTQVYSTQKNASGKCKYTTGLMYQAKKDEHWHLWISSARPTVSAPLDNNSLKLPIFRIYLNRWKKQKTKNRHRLGLHWLWAEIPRNVLSTADFPILHTTVTFSTALFANQQWSPVFVITQVRCGCVWFASLTPWRYSGSSFNSRHPRFVLWWTKTSRLPVHTYQPRDSQKLQNKSARFDSL